MKTRAILLFAAVMLVAARASADPIAITGGSVFIGSIQFGPFPPFGIELLGNDTAIRGVTFAQVRPFVRVGEVVDLSDTIGITSVTFGPFEQTVHGVTYNDVLIQGSLNFAATPFIVPRAAVGQFNTSFTMTGAVSIFERQGAGAPLFTTTLTGSGTAGISLERDMGDGSFSTGATGFSFEPAREAPVPEPGTLLLIAAGLAVAAFKRGPNEGRHIRHR